MNKLNKLYIYGDSFSADYEGEDWIWTRSLAEQMNKLNLVNAMKNASQAGTANDWLWYHMRNDVAQWQQGDYVIVIPTETARQWWFEDKPEMSNIMSLIYAKESKELKAQRPRAVQAVEAYYESLWRHDIDIMRFEHSMVWLKMMSIQAKVDLVIMPAFDMHMDYSGVTPTIGSLTETVCNGEFASEQDMNKWYSAGVDTRYNHMQRKNHAVLVQKLIDRFTEKTPVDLTTGFTLGELTIKNRMTLDDQLGGQLLRKARRAIGR
jgi:hypothetical protein